MERRELLKATIASIASMFVGLPSKEVAEAVLTDALTRPDTKALEHAWWLAVQHTEKAGWDKYVDLQRTNEELRNEVAILKGGKESAASYASKYPTINLYAYPHIIIGIAGGEVVWLTSSGGFPPVAWEETGVEVTPELRVMVSKVHQMMREAVVEGVV